MLKLEIKSKTCLLWLRGQHSKLLCVEMKRFVQTVRIFEKPISWFVFQFRISSRSFDSCLGTQLLRYIAVNTLTTSFESEETKSFGVKDTIMRSLKHKEEQLSEKLVNMKEISLAKVLQSVRGIFGTFSGRAKSTLG